MAVGGSAVQEFLLGQGLGAIVAAGQALIPFGGAITWDSDPESESREIGHKGRAILGTLGLDTCVDPETNLENLPG